MTNEKKAEGLKFILKLDMAADDERKLVQLARDAIIDSHDKRTFLERKNQDLQVNPTSINLGAAIGMSHAMMNNNISTNDKLYMVINKYFKLALQKNPKTSKEKALEHFCKRFADMFPQEYGEKQQKINSVNMTLLHKGKEI